MRKDNNHGSTTTIFGLIVLMFIMFSIVDYAVYEDNSIWNRYITLEETLANATAENLSKAKDAHDRAIEIKSKQTNPLGGIPFIGDVTTWAFTKVAHFFTSISEGFSNWFLTLPFVREIMMFMNMVWALILLDFTFMKDIGIFAGIIKLFMTMGTIYTIARLARGGG